MHMSQDIVFSTDWQIQFFMRLLLVSKCPNTSAHTFHVPNHHVAYGNFTHFNFSHSFCDPESFLWSVCSIIFFYKLFPLKWQVSSANIFVITTNAQHLKMSLWFFLLPFSTVYYSIICCFSLFFFSNALTEPEQLTWWFHHLGLQTCLFSHGTWYLGIRVNISPWQSFSVSGYYLICVIYW